MEKIPVMTQGGRTSDTGSYRIYYYFSVVVYKQHYELWGLANHLFFCLIYVNTEVQNIVYCVICWTEIRKHILTFMYATCY